MPRFVPIPDPGGFLDPPRRLPPTALATSAPDPEPDEEPAAELSRAYQAAARRCAALLRRAQALRLWTPARVLKRQLHHLGGRTVHALQRLAQLGSHR
jgi:hypothetical protein